MAASSLLACWLAMLALIARQHAQVIAKEQTAAGDEFQEAARCNAEDDASSNLMQLQQRQKVKLNASDLQPIDPCFETPYFCQEPVNCELPILFNICPKHCKPECKPPAPPPVINCSSSKTPDGACLAQQTACFLMEQMRQWDTSNENITKMKNQLRDQCYNNYTDSPPDDQEEQHAVVPSFASDCPDDSKSCAPDVIEYLSKNKGAKYGMQTGKAVSKGVADMTKEILKHFKMIALKGTIAFAFIGSFISAFFPSAGGLPTNPCTYASEKDWGRCVWEQIKPFVEKFVDEKIDGLFAELWDATLRGFQSNLWDINQTAYWDSEHFPNGTISNMPNKTRDRMFSRLWKVSEDMVQSAPLFAADHNINTTASLYLSMYAGMHISVMASVFGSWEYRTEGIRYTFQRHILCYARKVVERALQARKARMSAVRVDYGFRTECCFFLSTCMNCGGQRWKYTDDWQEACGYSATCDQEVKCLGLPNMCGVGPGCEESDSQHHFDCHRNYIQDQGDLMWQDWIGAVPDWIEIVKNMQESGVQENGLIHANEMSCPF